MLLAMPDVAEGATRGGGVFSYVLDASGMPRALKSALAIGIVLGYRRGLSARAIGG